MPELPEVESIARRLREGTAQSPYGTAGLPLLGKEIRRARLLWPRTLASPSAQTFLEEIRGQKIQAINRRGKILVFTLSSRYLLIHLRMSGDLLVEAPDKPIAPHHRMILEMDSGSRLAFNDSRKFGRVWLVPDPAPILDRLGPEPLDPDLTPDQFHKMLMRRKRQIKSLLLDQTFLAGVGNIYADEALFLARLHPQIAANRLDRHQSTRLLAAIRQVLEEGIRRNGAGIDWVYRGGSFQHQFQVYQRGGEPCSRCGAEIELIRVGQRATHFCPVCQVLDGGN